MTDVTSFNLRYGKLQLDEIKTHVKEILGQIGDSIQESHDKCETNIYFSLPYNFDIPNLNKLQSRKKIYALIIEDLTSPKRGFVVKLNYDPKNQKASLYITWLTEEDELLRQHEEEILEYYSKPFETRDSSRRPQSLPFDERIRHYQPEKIEL